MVFPAWLALWLIPALAAGKFAAPYRLVQAAVAGTLGWGLRLGRDDLGLVRPTARWVWGPIAALVLVRALFAGLVVASMLYGGMKPHLTLQAPTRFGPALMADILALAPILEELYYRGMLYRLIERWPRWPAILALAALFSLGHFGSSFISAAAAGGWGGGPFARWLVDLFAPLPLRFAAGVAFGYVRWRSGSVLPAMSLHLAFNALQLFASLDYGTPLLPELNP